MNTVMEMRNIALSDLTRKLQAMWEADYAEHAEREEQLAVEIDALERSYISLGLVSWLTISELEQKVRTEMGEASEDNRRKVRERIKKELDEILAKTPA